MRSVLLITAISLTFGLVLSSTAQVPEQPDLDVLFIEQWPVYSAYVCDYPGNVPILVHPGSGRDGKPFKYYYTRDEYEANVKSRPDEGDEMTITAFVANKGGVKVRSSDYLFKIDDEVVRKGRLPALDPGAKTKIEIKWPYKSGRHFVSFEVDPRDRIKEICETNNKRRDPTFGFVLTMAANNKGEYPAFNKTENLVGSYSFEDWCQAHIDKWREYFRDAKYPSTPDGVQAGVRINYIFPEYEGEEFQAYADKGGWCNWRIGRRLDDIPNYAMKIDGGLIHELVHQCGVIDSYAIGLGMLDNLARDPETGKTIEIPYIDHRWVHHSLMGGGFRDETKGAFSEHEAAAFDAIMKRWDNHAGYGLYLYDMPKNNIVRFLDNRGRPLAGAALTIFQQWADPHNMNSASRKTNKTTPKHVRLDDDGSFNMGENPYNTLWVVGGNSVIMYCVRAYGQKEYHFVDVREFNIAYWRGNEEGYTYVYRTNIAPLGSPAPPRNFRIVPDRSERARAVLAWDPPSAETKKIIKYRVRWNRDWKSAQHEPTYETVKEVDADVREVAIDYPERQAYIWFTITAVAEDGTESRIGEQLVWPVVEQVKMGLVRPIGTAIGPDGALYVIDNHSGTIFGVDAEDNLVNMSDTARVGGMWDITVTPSNRIFVVARGSKQEIIEIDTKEYKVVNRFGEPKKIGEGRVDFDYPYSIVADGNNRLFVMYPASSEIEVYDLDGKHLGTIEDKFDGAKSIAVMDQGDKTILAIPEFNARKVTMLELDSESLEERGRTSVQCAVRPLSTCFDDKGRLYVGTEVGIDRYEDGEKTGHWESRYNNKGHQVWDIAISGDKMICSEGGANEKYWMKGSLDDFAPVE